MNSGNVLVLSYMFLEFCNKIWLKSCFHLKFFLGLTSSGRYSCVFNIHINIAFSFVTNRYLLSLWQHLHKGFWGSLAKSLFQETRLELSLQNLSIMTWALYRWNLLGVWLCKAILTTTHISVGWRKVDITGRTNVTHEMHFVLDAEWVKA